MMVEPITVANDSTLEKRLNATLAWFIACQILETWNTGSTIKIGSSVINTIALYQEKIEINKSYPEYFMREHLTWLSLLNVTIEKPILLLAQCWRLFYLSCLALASEGKMELPNEHD